MHDDPHETIGFIGIGTMGARMAMRLLDAGFEVLVWNRTPDRCEALLARGAEEVDSVPELVEACDILLLCLPDASAVEEVVFGPEGVAGVADEEQLLVDLSGIDAEATRRFARELQAQSGAGWVDAPASGGPAAAAAGTLTLMAGGTEDDVERARPVLECLGRNVTHMGESGSGQLARACHQLLVDLSGIDADATRRFARELQAQSGAGWVDAPASGGPAAAAAGTLTLMAGGTEDDVERARPVLECLGRNVTHMGESGSGQLARACHQLMVGASTLLLAEMIALAERSGLDAELLPAAFAGGLADSPLLRVLAPRMAVREYEPLIARLGDVEKDLETALAAAREVDASLPMGALAAQLLRQHRARAGNDADSTSIVELYSAE